MGRGASGRPYVCTRMYIRSPKEAPLLTSSKPERKNPDSDISARSRRKAPPTWGTLTYSSKGETRRKMKPRWLLSSTWNLNSNGHERTRKPWLLKLLLPQLPAQCCQWMQHFARRDNYSFKSKYGAQVGLDVPPVRNSPNQHHPHSYFPA